MTTLINNINIKINITKKTITIISITNDDIIFTIIFTMIIKIYTTNQTTAHVHIHTHTYS